MRMIEAIAVDDALFTTSNVPEDDYFEWNSGATYAEGDTVMVAAVHKVYEAITAVPAGNDPTDLLSTYWLEISATNRWKSFDLKLADQTTHPGSITYSLTMTTMITALAFLNLNAGSVRVQVYDDQSQSTKIYDKTFGLVDTTDVVGWFSFFLGGVDYDTEALFVGVPGYSGYRIDITVDAASGDARVGQIVLGRVQTLGTTLSDTAIGVRDFSRKERDSFGNATIVERAFIDETSFQFVLPTDDARRVKRILARNRARPAVYFTDVDTARFGTTVFGYFQDFDIPLDSGGTSFATLEIEGLT